MIPKIIHYCWFGNEPLGEEENRFIETWKKKLPQYKIIEWNEKNFDVQNSCEYVKQAYSEKKWAFVSDYVRLKVLKEYGGIYLDTDVEVLKSFDNLLNCQAFIGNESKYSVCTATIGAEKNSEFIQELLHLYDGRQFIKNGRVDKTPNSKIIFKYLQDNYSFKCDNYNINNYENVTIYPGEYFSPINCYTMKENITENTISIHRYASTWKSPKEHFKDKILVEITRILGEDGREKLKQLIKGESGEN